MSKIVRLILISCVSLWATSVLSAQTAPCIPDVKYKDSASGVYPLPFVAVTRPNGGIDKAACLGKSYSFVWTVKVGDTVNVANPFGAGTIPVPLDSVTIARTAAIVGLPVGLNYACNPPSCSWKKKSDGCVLLSGTVAATNAIKVYPLTISGLVFASGAIGAIFPNGYALTFPGALAEGQYDLKVVAATDAACRVATEDLTEVSALTATPNPTNGKTRFQIESNVADKFQFSVTDLLGRTVHSTPLSIQSGLNTYEFDATILPNGIYIYTLSKGSRVMSNKLIVNQ